MKRLMVPTETGVVSSMLGTLSYHTIIIRSLAEKGLRLHDMAMKVNFIHKVTTHK